MSINKNPILILFFITAIFSCVNAENWKLDSRFANLDTIKMVQQSYPELLNQAERISHYSGYYSINPFLLAEQLLSEKKPVELVAAKLSKAIFANQNLVLSHKKAKHISTLMQDYKTPLIESKLANATNMPAMDLPFNHDESWEFNGVHTWTGADNGDAMSSIDMTKSWSLRWGNDTSNIWVAAAHDGVVSRFSSCFVRITHESGWATDYYHLDNIQFQTGDEVNAGTKIANIADNLAQATCQGGSSTGPHVHFALVKNGSRFTINNVDLSLWNIHSGTSSYDSDQSRMWLEKKEIKNFAYLSKVNHDNGDNEIDYRYSGIFSAPEINGHGFSINITQLQNQTTQVVRNVIFIAFYTYDDNGNANFYAGNSDFDNWRIDETKSIEMIQTSGGDFTNLQAINFDLDVVEAGTFNLHFRDCSQVDVEFSLTEPTTGATITKALLLTKLVGIPDEVCNSPSL